MPLVESTHGEADHMQLATKIELELPVLQRGVAHLSDGCVQV